MIGLNGVSILKFIMEELGFAEQCISLIMECVTTIQYKVKVNNEVTDIIRPTRGLHQGDHISPYLFLICAEGLISLLQ